MSPGPTGPAGPSRRRVRAVQAGLVAGVVAVWLAARRSPDGRLRLAPVRHTTVVERLGGLLDQVTVMGLATGLRERLTGTD